jgi:hypothetical protein
MADPIAVTSGSVVKYNTPVAVAAAAATSSVIDTAEDFEITYGTGDGRVLILATVADTHGSVVLTAPAGAFWAGMAQTVTVPQNAESAFVLEGAKGKLADGTIVITATPASGKRLATDHALKIKAINLF